MKKIIALLMSAVMAASLTACGGSGEKAEAEKQPAVSQAAGEEGTGDKGTGDKTASEEVVKFTITSEATFRTDNCQKFVDYVKEASGGKYQGEVLASGSLGTPADTAQMIQLGTLDFCLSDDMSIDGILDGALGFAWLPGLVANYEEADQYYNNGWIADQVAQIMEENQIIRISSFCNGFRQVGNIKRDVKEMKDLAGLKIRTPSVASVVSFYEKCGALPVMISGGEVLSALQTGTVDGLDNAIFNYINQGVTDVVTHVTLLNYCYSGGCYVASPSFFNELSEVDKQMFRDCAQKASDEFTEAFRTKTEDLLKEGEDSGQWVVSEPSDTMKAELHTIYEAIWEESRTQYSEVIMDAIISGDYKK